MIPQGIGLRSVAFLGSLGGGGQAAYGPQTAPTATTQFNVPPGSWTVGTILWGTSRPHDFTMTIINSDASDLWVWNGTFWESQVDSSDGGLVPLTGIFFVGNIGAPFNFWVGVEP